LLVLVAACAEVPITGRSQFILVSSQEMHQMSFQAYKDFLGKHKLSNNADQVAMTRRVGTRIQKAVEECFAQQGKADQLAGYEWEFNLIESDEVNAWCMPGGKVVVYTGILPLCKGEPGLAVVMGHEIAHAVARHGNERMSQQMVAQTGLSVLEDALAQQPQQTRELFLGALGLGANLGVFLPYSRLHENEADRLGLIFMAMAGYDPRQAVGFWQRMAALKNGEAPPEFLSTHPSDQTRITNIQRLVQQEALAYYKPEPAASSP
jgi:predicted Zn-dependent protease